MSAKRELLLREREFLEKRVREVQKEHADTMSRLRNAEHAHCVTEMEVERRSTMLLQKQTAECEELRHALDVYDEINFSDDQRLSMALRDLNHARALLEEEQGYVQDLWGDVKALFEDIHAEGTKYRQAAIREPQDMANLQADTLSARFVSVGVMNRSNRHTSSTIAETYEKERFEQHLFTQAIDKLRALEDERGRMIKGFMKTSELQSEQLQKQAGEQQQRRNDPVLHGVVTVSKEPSFAERARRLADQRYGTEDLLIRQAMEAEDNAAYSEASIHPVEVAPATEQQQQQQEQRRERTVEFQEHEKERNNASPPTPTSPRDGERPRTDKPTPQPADSSAPPKPVTSSAPPTLTWHGRRIGIRHVDPV